MAVDATSGGGNMADKMAAQSEALLAKQMEMNMQSERSTAASNMEKTRHDAMMAVISNFKS